MLRLRSILDLEGRGKGPCVRRFSTAPAIVGDDDSLGHRQGHSHSHSNSNSPIQVKAKQPSYKDAIRGGPKEILHPTEQTTKHNHQPPTTKAGDDCKQEQKQKHPGQNSRKARTNTTPDRLVDFGDISRAMVAIRSGIRRTKCTQSFFLSELCRANIFLKPEVHQFTGSFKERGARNAILSLLKEQESPRVIAASAGNHALALAYHGKQLGVPVTVVMPTVAPLLKVDRCRQFGATVLVEGLHIGESKTVAEELAAREGLTYVNGYDDPPIVAGAGTIGMEIVEDVPDADVVVVPVGGAGLIAGVSCAVKTLKPCTRVVGVEPERCASYTEALRKGHPFDVSASGRSRHKNQNQTTLADGLAVPEVGSHAFALARQHVDECVLVDERAISLAVLRLIENEKIVVEGGGATGLAALLPGGPLSGRPEIVGKNVVVPLCGGNIDTAVLGRVLERGLASDARLCSFTAEVSDRPGGIEGLTKVLRGQGASIKNSSGCTAASTG